MPTIVVSPASFAASIRPSVTVLRQSTHVPKTSKKRALRGIVVSADGTTICGSELGSCMSFLVASKRLYQRGICIPSKIVLDAL